MTAIKKELYKYIDCIPDKKLKAIKPLLKLLSEDALKIESKAESNLTEEEKEILLK